jgi:exopolysaccharide biosynthesis polyprenyl glycosylphosphotransferase
MSGAARQDFSPLVIGTSAEPGSTPATSQSGLAKRPNLVALASIACLSEALAVAGGLWASCVVCGALIAEFHAPQSWFGLLVCALMVASIAERGDYRAGVILDCGLRPWSLAKASLQTAGAVLLLACPSIIVGAAVLGQSATPFEMGGMEPATLIVWVFAFVAISFVGVLCVRLVGRVATAPLARPRRVVVVGEADRCGSLISSLHQARRQSMSVLGIIGHEGEAAKHAALARRTGLPVVGQLHDLVEMVQRGKVDVVIVALPWLEATRIREIIGSVEGAPVDVLLVPDLGAFELFSTPTAEPASVPLLRAIYRPLLGWRAFVKRTEDIVIAGAITVLAAPTMVIVAALVKLTSRGPVFSRQQRLGYRGEVFEALKFRTVCAYPADAHGADQIGQGDPEATPFGAWLRCRSLDELPQLINVLLGHMSLVGPCPDRAGITTDCLPPEQAASVSMLRQRVRPGLTGWAQVNGHCRPLRASATMDKITCDLEYIRDWSLAFDLKILWLTVGSLINDRSAR